MFSYFSGSQEEGIDQHQQLYRQRVLNLTGSNLMFFLVLTSPSKDIFLQEVTMHLIKFSPSSKSGDVFPPWSSSVCLKFEWHINHLGMRGS